MYYGIQTTHINKMSDSSAKVGKGKWLIECPKVLHSLQNVTIFESDKLKINIANTRVTTLTKIKAKHIANRR